MTFKNRQPKPRAGRDRTEARASTGFKSPFVSLRGQTFPHKHGSWEVFDLIEIVERNSGESDWQDVLWSCKCSACSTLTIMDRREIKGKSGVPSKQCPVCKAGVRVEKANAKRLERSQVSAAVTERAARHASIVALANAGLSQHKIAKQLGTNQGSVSTVLKKAGVSTQYTFKVRGQRVKVCA